LIVRMKIFRWDDHDTIPRSGSVLARTFGLGASENYTRNRMVVFGFLAF
jgi:hypothetical protein